MALTIGDQNATSGMAKAIYTAMDSALRPALKNAGMSDDDITSKIDPSWRSLSFALASGLVPVLHKDPLPPPAADPTYAETYSSAASDGSFWTWLAGFVAVFQAWAPATPDGQALKTALQTFLASNAVPKELKGILR
jgi:hypothetical protein